MIAVFRGGSARATAQAAPGAAPDASGVTRRPSVGNQTWLRRLAQNGPTPAPAGGGPGLLIGDQNDPLEREADHVADQVMRTPASDAPPPDTPVTGPLNLGRKCSACEKEKPKVQAKAAHAPVGAGQVAPSSVHGVLNTPGRPLDTPLREFFEPRFGSDFSAVRLHTDTTAGASAREVGALAYAVGHHVVVDPDHYRPDSDTGRRLLAHELTHTLQQGAGQPLAKLRRVGDGEIAPDVAAPAEPQEELDEDNTEDSDEDDDTEDGDTPVDGLDDRPDFDLDFMKGLDAAPEPSPDDPSAPSPAQPMATANPEPAAAPASDEAEPQGRDPSKKKPGGKITHIDVDQTAQRMVLTYANGVKSPEYVVSTGHGECGIHGDPCKSQSNHNCTPNITNRLVIGRGTGTQKNGHGDKIWWFVGLDTPGRTGIGIHNSQRADGKPRSHGCVRTGRIGEPGEGLAEMINKGVLVKKTTVTITGKAKTGYYPCPVKGKKGAGGKKGKKK